VPRAFWLLIGLVLLVGALAGAFALRNRRRGWHWASSNVSSAPSPRTNAKWQLPPIPDVALQISDNDGDELTVYQGTPLVFSITLGNQRAMSAMLQNRANELHRSSLEARVARGEISRQQADHVLATLRQREVPVIRLGQENAAWPQFLHFVLRSADGKEEPLPWPLQLLRAPATNSVILDDKTTPQLTYLLAPTAAAQVSPGTYEVAAVLEVKEETQLPAELWRGRVASEPMKLTIVARPAQLAPAEMEKLNLQFAYYYQAANDLPQALQLAQAVLAATPHSIPAQIVVAQVKEARGDLRGALESYQTAQSEFSLQHPDSYEPPAYLIYKSIQLRNKLGSQP